MSLRRLYGPILLLASAAASPTLAAVDAASATPCYTLENAETTHRAHPRRFSIPRASQRANLPVGQEVKMTFSPCRTKDRPAPFDERMWVIVKGKTADGYVGQLDNDPVGIEGLQAGDEVRFGPEHVIAFTPVGDQLDLPWGKFAMASADILNADAWPVEATRRAPRSEDDSGWTVRSKRPGDGAPAAPLVKVRVDALIAAFQILDSVLDEPAGTDWRWNETRLEYEAGPAPVNREPAHR